MGVKANFSGKGAALAQETVDMVIIGAGFGGLCMAIKMREAGNNNFVILEKGTEVGGTWWFNNYPGAACDVQSHLYSFSFAGNPDWSKRYASCTEIEQYILKTTEEYGIRPYVRFGQTVNYAAFDEATGRWTVRTESGHTVSARQVVLASGPLHVPAIPSIKGLDTFKGKVFHSAEWDHSYDMAGKNVVSIGTGGSAIQYVPEIAPRVKQLYVFQRTPAWVIPRDERGYLSIEKKLFARFPALRKLHRTRLYWTNEARVWPMSSPKIAQTLQKGAEFFIRTQIKDPVLRKKLTPDYTIGCKRVLISNKYYPTFNRPNVELVTDGIQEIREHSIVTRDGVERPADCIVLGTGFVVDPRIYMKNFPVLGARGHELNKDWAVSSASYYGITTHGYPNLFMLVGPNTGLGHNSIIFMIEAQVNYVMQCVAMLRDRRADYMDVRQDVQDAFNNDLQEKLKGTVWTSGCQSWYQQADGKNTVLWPKGTWRYWLETRRVNGADYVFANARPEAAALTAKTPATETA